MPSDNKGKEKEKAKKKKKVSTKGPSINRQTNRELESLGLGIIRRDNRNKNGK